MKKYIQWLFSLFFILFACSEEEDKLLSMNHVLIVYMAADNDLSGDAYRNLEQIKKGYIETGNKLIIFMDMADKLPELSEVSSKKTTVLKEYTELNSASAETLHAILSDVIELYPCEHYGLILWSHGTSWLPSGTYLRSFGEDQGKQMNIKELAEALPVRFNYILFDACLMGAVEVAYELKEKTNYMLAPSTETIADGFPYSQILPELLNNNYNLEKVARNYFDYYNSKKGTYRSATISLIDTKELKKLADETNNLCKNNPLDLNKFDRLSVQNLDVYFEQYHFDLSDFINKAFPDADKSLFTEQLNKAVIYKANTPQFLERYNINIYGGLSCYIPHPDRPDLNLFYRTLKWATDSGIRSFP
jgi:hypothetical protein